MQIGFGELIREERTRRQWTLESLASRVGVSKSHLSRLESGTRTPTPEQLARFATTLELPVEILRLTSGRFPPDIDGLVGRHAFEITAALRQEKEAAASGFYTRLSAASVALIHRSLTRPLVPPPAPFSGTLRAGKNNTEYRTHSYHTKIPPDAINKVLEHYTRPGDIVLDPFCGSGMTGVAAIRSGRNAILSDLSPAAVHIARNYTTPCAPETLRAAVARLATKVQPIVSWLYDVAEHFGRRATVEYTTWSDIFECPACSADLLYWTAARSNRTGQVCDVVRCENCGGSFEKRELCWIGEQAVESNTSSADGRGRSTHPPTARELQLVERADSTPNPYWTPNVPFDHRREMWRAGHTAAGIDSVAKFYTRRNLFALSALRHHILEEPDERLRDALLFVFTAIVNRASKRYQWNLKRPTNVMTGTLYVSSLRYEWNVWSLFRRKAADAIRFYERLGSPEGGAETILASATRIAHVPDAAIDFVFMDPPFGSNIFYADSSLLWEAWLGRLTDEAEEIVVNVHRTQEKGGKSLDEYGSLMTAAFSEARRVLKPGGYAALVFNNTKDEIWARLQDSCRDAGLEIVAASGLDKIHPSIKGVKGLQDREDVASFDAVISLRARTGAAKARVTSSEYMTQSIIENHLRAIAPEGATTDELFALAVRTLLAADISIAGLSMDSVRAASERVGLLGGRSWHLRNDAPKPLCVSSVYSPYGCVAAEYLGNPTSLISGTEERQPKRVTAFEDVLVPGQRNTGLYNAHSYHTKVPPESIAPFLEHYTRPGDIVLDPFCGSGMTGVAAAITGRRAILNDLSVAATHLSFNHTRPCDHHELQLTFQAIYDRVRPHFEKTLYATQGVDGSVGYVQYTLWSRDARCPKCDSTFSMWDVIDRLTGRMAATVPCPNCGAPLSKQGLRYEGNRPVLVSFLTTSGQRLERAPTAWDLQHIGTFRREDIVHWYPHVALGRDREMFIRSALHLQGIASVADFYTPRNLCALAVLWHEIQQVRDERIRQALSFAFTNTAWHGTRMRRFNARGGQRPLTGTLYIPQLSSEANVLEVMRHKIKQLATFYSTYRPSEGTTLPVITLGSATMLDKVPNGCVDYVFTDPPFGSNIFYADCNVIWESWLGGLTQTQDEAVVNRSLPLERGGKSVADYERLMGVALTEVHRVLKPGGWATLVFHNTDPAVWRALQTAAATAGFSIERAAGLDRKQRSHKGYKGRSGDEDVAHYDVVFSMRKDATAAARPRPLADDSVLRRITSEIIGAQTSAPSTQFLHSALIRRLAEDGFDLGSVTYERVRALQHG